MATVTARLPDATGTSPLQCRSLTKRAQTGTGTGTEAVLELRGLREAELPGGGRSSLSRARIRCFAKLEAYRPTICMNTRVQLKSILSC